MNLRRLLPPFLAVILCATALASVGAFWFAGASLDTLLYFRHSLHGDRHVLGESPAVIVAIDDATLARPDLKDVPLALWAPALTTALQAIDGAGAKVIGFDIVLGATAEAVLPGHDRTLIAALREVGGHGRLVLAEARVVGRNFRPHPIFAFAAGGPANIRPVNVTADRDGIIRGVPLLLESDHAGQPVPGIALELARRAGFGADPAGNSLLLNFADRAPAPIYSLGDVLDCAAGDPAALAAAFGGKVVLIGSTIDIDDRKVVSGRLFVDPGRGLSPLSCASRPASAAAGGKRTTVPGVIVHAEAVNDLLRSEILRDAGPVLTGVCLLLLAALGGAAALAPRWGAPAAIAAAPLWTFVAVAAAGGDVVLPWIGGLAALGFAYVGMLGYRNIVLDRERRRSVLALSRYLDPALARSLLEGPRPPELGGELREVTVWFSDIADFSTLAETLPPQQLLARLNAHFAMVAAAVEDEGGIIDKFVGDAVVAIFGAPLRQPDHAARALRAARRVVAAVSAPADSPGGFRVRIGLNTGPALVGNIGTRRRFDYTAIGDTVNVAQRIEQANKEFGTVVLASAATAAAAGGAVDLAPLGPVKVKGRDAPVEVWTLGSELDRSVA